MLRHQILISQSPKATRLGMNMVISLCCGGVSYISERYDRPIPITFISTTYGVVDKVRLCHVTMYMYFTKVHLKWQQYKQYKAASINSDKLDRTPSKIILCHITTQNFQYKWNTAHWVSVSTVYHLGHWPSVTTVILSRTQGFVSS